MSRAVIYVEKYALFTFTKNGQGPLKNVAASACNIIAFFYLDHRYLDQRKVPLPLVPLGYPWLPCDYIILPRLYKISAHDGNNNCKCANKITYIGIEANQGYPGINKDKQG